MIRILHVFGQLNTGGAESRIMDIYRNINRDEIQFDFVVHSDKEGTFEAEIQSLGGHIYRVPRFISINIHEYKKAWNKLYQNIMLDESTKVKMVHGHMTSTASIYLPIAKKYGIESTIAHVRSAGTDPGIKGIATRFLRLNLANKADYLFACSNIAAISAFGKKAFNEGRTVFIPNAIDVDRFTYSNTDRTRLRKELGIPENCIVIGHVGRFHYAKNHNYLLQVFDNLHSNFSNINIKTILLLVGDGPLLEGIKSLATNMELSDSVMFAGNQKETWKYYSAMDYFLYPSLYEGLPGAVVEAQANGLKCLISDSICDEVMITDLISKMSLDETVGTWSSKIASDLEHRIYSRQQYISVVKDAGFDVHTQAQRLQNFYKTEKI